MKIKKNFLHNDAYLPPLSLAKIVTGISLGLLFAFSFYNFLYLSREAMRLLFFRMDEYPLLVLPDKITHLHNLFLAFLSLIIGQSICFIYLFDYPMGRLGKARIKMRAIVNDQRYMNSFFLLWFSRLAYVFAVVIGGAHLFPVYSPAQYGSFNFLLLLIIPVLFLHTWINLRRLFQHSLRWMSYSIITLSLLAFALSCFHPINVRALNKISWKNNLWSAYEIRLPESEWTEQMESYNRRRVTVMMVREKEDTPTSTPLLFIDPSVRYDRGYRQVSFDTLMNVARCWREIDYPEHFGTYVLYIDREIKMKEVHHLKRELAKAGEFRLNYGAVPTDRIYDAGYYRTTGIYNRISPYFGDSTRWKEVEAEFPDKENRIEIQYLQPDQLLVNGRITTPETLQTEIENFIENHSPYIIFYETGDNLPYKDYIEVLGHLWKGLMNHRYHYAMKHYNKEYDLLNEKEQEEINSKYPMRLIEIPEDMKQNLPYTE